MLFHLDYAVTLGKDLGLEEYKLLTLLMARISPRYLSHILVVISVLFWFCLFVLQSHRGSWWRHQMGTISASLALCEGNSPVTGEFPSQRAVTRSYGVFFDLHLNKRLNKQSRRWWFETQSHSLWRHGNCQIELCSKSGGALHRR